MGVKCDMRNIGLTLIKVERSQRWAEWAEEGADPKEFPGQLAEQVQWNRTGGSDLGEQVAKAV